MAKIVNYDTPRVRKPRNKDSNGNELIKNQECVTCKKMYSCKGKPRNTTQCVNYEDRTS